MFGTSHTFNCIPKQGGSWDHIPPTENMHCKISSLMLRHSAIIWVSWLYWYFCLGCSSYMWVNRL